MTECAPGAHEVWWEVFVGDVPPSMNTNAIRSHWRGFHTHKKQWQAILETLLLSANLPRPIPADGPVRVECVFRWPDRRRRDTENYRVLLSKALGDALVNGGWLTDDTDDDWLLITRRDPEPGPRETAIRIGWVPG